MYARDVRFRDFGSEFDYVMKCVVSGDFQLFAQQLQRNDIIWYGEVLCQLQVGTANIWRTHSYDGADNIFQR